MAAPPEKTIKNLSGKWNLNKSLSDSIDPVLTVQGISWLLRTAIGAASISLDINQYEAPPSPPNTSTELFTHIDIEQTAAGLKSTNEKRTVDAEWREHSDWLFGNVKGKSFWVGLDDVEDDFLKQGWLKEGDDEKFLFKSYVESLDNGWVASQIWGFQEVQGERRHVRKILVTKDSKRAAVTFVYDYAS
ncbi:hypothetical protein NLU13_9084 [Sarocladium strictum]|uniref:Uncharacterized protein n=1 Tax=Sarocladium strictum TaxID=5046 RepID=A0AA39G9Y5_SARSR|nr:hypothetical protein NLU13_9084 [Sarocladium strictum]